VNDEWIIKTTDTSSLTWGELTGQTPGFHNTNQIMVNPPAVEVTPFISLDALQIQRYPEGELRALRDRIDKHLGPKPPKFTSVEEADAWMEEHYG
jgi:hypothetical protein